MRSRPVPESDEAIGSPAEQQPEQPALSEQPAEPMLCSSTGLPCQTPENSCLSESHGSREDACPTPLSWKDVLGEFREQATVWETTAHDGAILHGRTWGEGPPVLFLNGLLGDLELHALTVWLLRENFRCILWDYPTRRHDGRRERSVSATRSADDYAQDIATVANHHREPRFDLFAQGWGLLPAVRFAGNDPSRVNRLAVLNGFVTSDFSRMERIGIHLATRLPGTLRLLPGVQMLLQHNHRGWFPQFDSGRWNFTLQNMLATPLSAVAGRSAVLRGLDLTPELGRLACPVLAIRPEGEGALSARQMERFQAARPQAEIEYMHTAGHLLALTHPHRLRKVLRQYFQGERPPADTQTQTVFPIP